MQFHVISIFPEACESYLNASILKRAQEKKYIKTNLIQLRDFATDKHNKVDDSPYGGGPGMVLKVEPIEKAVNSVKRKIPSFVKTTEGKKVIKTRTILFSTRGKVFNQKMAQRLSRYDHLILICGRYEGVDERVADYIADEEISLGDFVLSGGELPAMVVIDAVARQIPGVLGKHESLEEVKGSYPVYTKPEEVVIKDSKGNKKKCKVPIVLLSGNHKNIEKWRKTAGKR